MKPSETKTSPGGVVGMMTLLVITGGRPHIELLYAEHGPALVAYATSLLGDRGAAEDVLHQVFLKLLDAGAILPDDARPYLFRAVRNAALNRRRGDGREALRRAKVPMFLAPAGLQDTALELESQLAALPAEQRQMIVLRIWGQLTIEEAAEVEGIPPNTAASRYRYALARLRERLGVVRRT